MTSRHPLVSCIMPTADRRAFVPRAIGQFLAQDYPHLELVVLDDGAQPVADLIPADSRIRYVREDRRAPLGAKRNRACALARGDVILHCDDDDWMAPWRVSYQLEQLRAARADVCGLDRVLFYDPAAEQGWEYVYASHASAWVYGATLCYTKAFWQAHPFPPVNVGEDSRFVWAAMGRRVHAHPDQSFFVGMIHPGNTSRKQTGGQRWRPSPAAALQALLSGWAAAPAVPRGAEMIA